MICRVILAYGPYSVGHVFTDMPGNVARTLIARHLIEEAEAEAEEAKPEEKQFTSSADRMMRGGVKKQAVRK